MHSRSNDLHCVAPAPRRGKTSGHTRWPLRIAAVLVALLAGNVLYAAQPASAQDVSEPMTILIMGVNAPPDAAIDVGVRPVALTVMHIDPATGSCTNLAVPSDSLVELPGYGETKIRHALMVGGIPFQQLVTETYLGIDMDHYVLVDFTGFQELVDAVGGITVNVPQELTSPSIPATGAQTIDGEQALGHARWNGGGDFVRIQRQQTLIQGIIEELDGLNLLTEANDVLPAVQDHIRTDLGVQDMAAVGNYFADNCSNAAMEMDTIPGEVVYGPIVDPLFDVPLSYVVSDPAVVQEKVDALLASGS